MRYFIEEHTGKSFACLIVDENKKVAAVQTSGDEWQHEELRAELTKVSVSKSAVD